MPCIALDAAMGVDNQKKVRVIPITSALPHEGNTVSSVTLAIALAASGSKPLLIDADMRRPQMRAYLPALARAGFDLDPCRGPRLSDCYGNRQQPLCHQRRQRGRERPAGLPVSAIRHFHGGGKGGVRHHRHRQSTGDARCRCGNPCSFRRCCSARHSLEQTGRSTALAAVDRMRRANGGAVGVTMLNRVTPAKYEKYNRDGAWSFKYADYYHTATRTSAVNRYPR
jgi:hypothetical protein